MAPDFTPSYIDSIYYGGSGNHVRPHQHTTTNLRKQLLVHLNAASILVRSLEQYSWQHPSRARTVVLTGEDVGYIVTVIVSRWACVGVVDMEQLHVSEVEGLRKRVDRLVERKVGPVAMCPTTTSSNGTSTQHRTIR